MSGTINHRGYCNTRQWHYVSNGQEWWSGTPNIGAKEKSRVAHYPIGTWWLERFVRAGPSGENSNVLKTTKSRFFRKTPSTTWFTKVNLKLVFWERLLLIFNFIRPWCWKGGAFVPSPRTFRCDCTATGLFWTFVRLSDLQQRVQHQRGPQVQQDRMCWMPLGKTLPIWKLGQMQRLQPIPAKQNVFQQSQDQPPINIDRKTTTFNERLWKDQTMHEMRANYSNKSQRPTRLRPIHLPHLHSHRRQNCPLLLHSSIDNILSVFQNF